MVAKISTPKRVLTALNYNEQKVKSGKAECLGAFGYLRNADQLNFYQKLEGLESRNALNTRATTKSIHVSLNFDPSEQLSKHRLLAIAERYMTGIGFEGQPYLIYQHHDAGHPHLHIVASSIREDGSRINLHNLGKGASEKTRKEIEKKFGLVIAQGKRQRAVSEHKPKGVTQYGVAETVRSIENAVLFVRRNYRYSSLPQFNACLRQFGIIADTGKEGSRMNRHGGIQYRMLDDKGAGIGVPIKGSRLSGQPTLKNLQSDFQRLFAKRDHHQREMREKLASVVRQGVTNLPDFIKGLQQVRIQAICHASSEGKLYGIAYVDHDSKVVFNGSELGKDWSAAGIIRQMNAGGQLTPAASSHPMKSETRTMLAALSPLGSNAPMASKELPIITDILSPEKETSSVQGSLLPKKRKRKRNHPNQNL